MKKLGRKKTIWLIVCAVLLAFSAACAIGVRVQSRRLLSQREYERWRGDNELGFCQISCFMPRPSSLGLNGIFEFRYAVLEAVYGAGVEEKSGVYPFIDAWSAEDKLTITGARGATDAPALAVGGAFFEFHPLRLLSGSYLSEDDLSPDRVVLDRELAWELFGGVELTGMRVQVNGVELVVGGVVDREDDWASRKAYTGEKGFFMSYDTWRALTEKDAVDCYEIVLPEPVKGFGAQLVADRFPLGEGESVVNSTRFETARLLHLARTLPLRAAHSGTVSYPYWENAARIAEDRCAVLASLCAFFAAAPAATAIFWAIRFLVRGRRVLEEDLLPRAKEGVEEAVRVRARRRWEKKHPS